MMACFHNPLSVYQKNHSANLSYPPTSWYQSYPPPHHANPNQFLGSATAGGNGGSLSSSAAGMQDNESTTPTMYYPHPHAHSMFHQTSPDWAYDNFHMNSQNSSLLQSMSPSAAAIHLNQSLNGGLNSSSSNATDNLTNGLQNVPPSPPPTVNSGCSEMSSPGITVGGSGGHGGSSPHIGGHSTHGNNSSGGGLARQKSPYDWIKKTSYQTQPHPGNFFSILQL